MMSLVKSNFAPLGGMALLLAESVRQAFRRPFERAPGALFVAYVGLYSLGRFWIEGLRTDSLMAGSLRAAQVASVIGVLLACVGLPLLLRRRRA